MPTDKSNAVLIKFVTNTGGGEPGDPCPMDCNAADALIEAYYPIADPADDHCYQVRPTSFLNILLSCLANLNPIFHISHTKIVAWKLGTQCHDVGNLHFRQHLHV